MFEGLRSRIEQFLAQHTAPGDPRASAAQLHQAVLDAKVAVSQMRDALGATERELTVERRHQEDAERRGRLAREIDDQETAGLADRFSAKHAERVQVLERKLQVQRDELALAEREVAEMTAQLKSIRGGAGAAAASSEAAWRDLQAAGGARPGVDPDDELLRSRLDRSAYEAAAEAQLAHLKRKMGKSPDSNPQG